MAFQQILSGSKNLEAEMESIFAVLRYWCFRAAICLVLRRRLERARRSASDAEPSLEIYNHILRNLQLILWVHLIVIDKTVRCPWDIVPYFEIY
jgi:hypothetical protein